MDAHLLSRPEPGRDRPIRRDRGARGSRQWSARADHVQDRDDDLAQRPLPLHGDGDRHRSHIIIRQAHLGAHEPRQRAQLTRPASDGRPPAMDVDPNLAGLPRREGIGGQIAETLPAHRFDVHDRDLVGQATRRGHRQGPVRPVDPPAERPGQGHPRVTCAGIDLADGDVPGSSGPESAEMGRGSAGARPDLPQDVQPIPPCVPPGRRTRRCL